MASYFGEVIHPSSRAFWNDDEDAELPDDYQEVSKFVIEWNVPEPTELKNFYIIEDQIAIDFVENCLLEDATAICTISCDAEQNVSKIYIVSDTYFCLVNKKFNLAQAGQFVETIAPILSKSKNLIAVVSDHISHYKSEEEVNSVSFLKALHSFKARSNIHFKIPTLNQPNIVTGVCAGVLSYAEISNLPCSMYILYTDTFTLDSKTSIPLTSLFSDLLGRSVPNFTTKGSSFFNKGNLYM